MKKLVLFLIVLFYLKAFSQEEEELIFKSYSFSEFFKMLEDEPSDTFALKNAIIERDTATDKAYLGKIAMGIGNFEPLRKDTIYIRKELILENVHFFNSTLFANEGYIGFLNHMVFSEPVTLTNVSGRIRNVLFKKRLRIYTNERYNVIRPSGLENRVLFLNLKESTINNITLIIQNSTEDELLSAVWIESCKFVGSGRNPIFPWNLSSFLFRNNDFGDMTTALGFSLKENNQVTIEGNNFNACSAEILIEKSQNQSIQIVDNTFNSSIILKIPESIDDIRVDWNQFKAGVVDVNGYYEFFQTEYFPKLSDSINDYLLKPEIINEYKESFIIPSEKYYKSEVRLLGTLNAIYKRQHDTQSSNASFIALKDLETKRLAYLYGQAPSFGTFFEWKVNQFLKLFSDYGTKPSKAIVMSVYVILAFALIYLFFPNHWDSHGKNRIKDRYLFFLKYLSLNKGIHDVYLEEKKEDIQEGEHFRSILEKHRYEAPAIFYQTAMPLYRWSVAGTRLYSRLLRGFDFLKGTWKETDPKIRPLRTVLVVLMFAIALLYDLFIKVLNAVMLSINTFTTLGFGEIPIKGLPRYLAIIQGFIGWFMLTIFSVSLISQLLN